MFGSTALALPSPYAPDHRTQRLYTEPARPQPSGQCHFLMLHAGSREQRCPCQGFQHNRNAPGSLCDCTHAACYHAHSLQNDTSSLHENSLNNGNVSSNVLERLRKLEDLVQLERDLRETMLARERQSWEKEIRVLREALSPFYKTEQDMQQRLSEIETRLNNAIKEHMQMRAKITSIEDANPFPDHRMQQQSVSETTHRRKPSIAGGVGPIKGIRRYSSSEDRTSVSTEPISPRPSANTIVAEQESPRSSGILNMVELPRAVLTNYALPPRLSPPVESEEPRSSGFLALDVKELVRNRKVAKNSNPAQAYHSPTSSATKSPPVLTGRNLTPQSLPRVSPPTGRHPQSRGIDSEDRVHKKRKHQSELMALDVLADVSAASPVMS